MLLQNVWIHCINDGPKPKADNVRNKKIPAYCVKRFFNVYILFSFLFDVISVNIGCVINFVNSS